MILKSSLSAEAVGNYPSQSASNVAPVRNPNPYSLITQGCHENNIAQVLSGIQAASSNDTHKDSDILSWSLRRAVYHGQPDIVRYLIEREGAQMDSLSPAFVSVSPSIALLQILFDHGWDINQCPEGGLGGGKSLLQLVCSNESLVHWCLDHGASVENPHPDSYKCPPLLELVTGGGTLHIFTLLRSWGAQLGPRTLHRAARTAGSLSSNDERLATRMAIVEHLVDDVGLDVNAMDTEGQMPNYWGTPLNYAVHAAQSGNGDEVVRFLLDQGANPFIKDCWGIHDAFGYAELNKNAQMSERLRAKMAQKTQKE